MDGVHMIRHRQFAESVGDRVTLLLHCILTPPWCARIREHRPGRSPTVTDHSEPEVRFPCNCHVVPVEGRL
jgi:hypothetical protein